ncbi:hypothetical protein EZ449_13130 [Pedobacter frigidisoli]|uniref:Uncharacterized protein n=1 Tax=Pedobacter frigidisoli TaxID=2530455 RepID=A0A4R0P2U9_9SPHI|nr:hypothetical protein [Pedobacter frigidisoli]TCD08338.1 hypothetical protein EZ449_13130 [Pedobacter frigidisoli]
MEKEDLIPSQQIGKQTDAEQEKLFSSPKAAGEAYHLAMVKLLDVNAWHKISGIDTTYFELFDRNGNSHHHTAKESDYIRIDVSGAVASEGKCYWVCIEHMECYSQHETDVEFTLFVARPCKVPGEIGGSVAHFFTNRATSTFMVFRRGNVLTAGIYGRNEVANTVPDGMLDKSRNVVYKNGSADGMSFAQWQLVLAGILA